MPPGVNLVRHHGVFAPASPLRSRVVPTPPPTVPQQRTSRWVLWWVLFKRVFGRERTANMNALIIVPGLAGALPPVLWTVTVMSGPRA